MPFRIPTFNLLANVWHYPQTPADPPDLTIDAQLRAPGRQSIAIYPAEFGSVVMIPAWELLVPALTDIQDYYNSPGTTGDIVEVPAGSGRTYQVVVTDDVAKGFANEYRLAYIVKMAPPPGWPVPMP